MRLNLDCNIGTASRSSGSEKRKYWQYVLYSFNNSQLDKVVFCGVGDIERK